MKKISSKALPQVIQSYIAGLNNRDPEVFMATLAPNALVNDVKREFLGHQAIRAWADKELFGDKVTLQVEEAFEQSSSTIVRFRVDGDFDKSKLPDPLILTFYFIIQNNLITLLIILLNSKNAS